MVATRYLVLATALALAPACGSDSSTTVIVDDPVGDTVAEGQAMGDDLADNAYGELNGDDYQIVIGKTGSILAALNDGEINQADFAIDFLVDDDVFQFANVLIADHDDANIDLDFVVRSYGIGYIPSNTADTLALEANAGIGELRAAAPGDLDFVFVDLQVRMHAAAQVMLDELYAQVGPGEMGDFILDTQDMIDAHLAESTDLLSTYY
jgi:predicted outer membrane protein